jgi:CheY-like chemotaxis protein
VRPDLLLSDIAMPGRDGFDLVREVRSSGDSLATIPAIALTAFAHADDRRRAIEAGFDGHLPKPVDLDELAGAIRRLLAARRAVEGPA